MSHMDMLKKELKREFPSIDKDLQTYVEGMWFICANFTSSRLIFGVIVLGVLSSSADDFESSEEIYDAIGEILHEVAGDKTEDDIRSLCTKFHTIMRPHSNGSDKQIRKILAAPIYLGEMAAEQISDVDNMTSIWMQGRNETSKVNAKKLEKAEAKLQQKQEKREGVKPTVAAVPVLQTASASQVRKWFGLLWI